MYFENAARSFAAGGEMGKARSAYESIRDDYPNSQAARNVDFYIAQYGSGK